MKHNGAQKVQIAQNGSRLRGEKIIRLKNVKTLDLWLEEPSYDKVLRWVRYGFYKGRDDDGRPIMVKLESRREGRIRMTSVEAVSRFLEAIQ